MAEQKLTAEGVNPQANPVEPLVQVEPITPARNSRAAQIANSLARIRPQLSNVFNQRIAKDITDQKRKAALLATTNQALPKGFFEESEQVYNETRGAIAGRRASQQLELQQDSFLTSAQTQAQEEGGDVTRTQEIYSEMVDNFISEHFSPGNQDFGIGQLSAFEGARAKADKFFLDNTADAIKNEYQSTLKGAVSVFIDNAKEKGEQLDLEDYNNFRTLAQAMGVQRDEANKLYVEQLSALAVTSGNYKMLDHLFTPNKSNSGLRMSEDSVLGNTIIKAREASMSKFVSIKRAEERKEVAQVSARRDKAFSDTASLLIQNRGEDMSDTVATNPFLSGSQKTSLTNFTRALQKDDANIAEDQTTKVQLYAQLEDDSNPLTVSQIANVFTGSQLTGSGISSGTAMDLINKVNSRNARGEQPSAFKTSRNRLRTMYGDPKNYFGVDKRQIEANTSLAIQELEIFNMEWQREHPNEPQDSELAMAEYTVKKDEIMQKYFIANKSESTYYTDKVDKKIIEKYLKNKY